MKPCIHTTGSFHAKLVLEHATDPERRRLLVIPNRESLALEVFGVPCRMPEDREITMFLYERREVGRSVKVIIIEPGTIRHQ